MPKIVVHCLVKNEENFIWYALNSILPFVDKIMVWDTGSEDKTVQIIKSIKSSKIYFVEKGIVDRDSFTKLRNEMLSETDFSCYNWLFVLDGDEIWPTSSIKKVIDRIQNFPNTQAIFVRTINSIGDIYHKLPESTGQYRIKGKRGHFNLRFINLKEVHNLKVNLPYGQEGYYSDSIPVQELSKVDFVDTYYLHTTHLPRSILDKETLLRNKKRKYELGLVVKKAMLPEVFFQKHPSIVPPVTQKMEFNTLVLCAIETIPKRVKRLFVK